MRRTLTGLVLGASLLLAAAPVVSAHECYVVNRSEQGNIGADHSGRWEVLPLAAIFGFIHEVVGGPALTPDQIDWAVAEAADQGLPADGWLTRSDRTIGGGPRLADGKGLDHLADVFGEQIVGIYFEALGH
jgi:hypothetical protein